MRTKPKICLRCKKPEILKGHGLCPNCYNIEYWKWDAKRPTRTFKEAMQYKYPSKGKIVAQQPKEPAKRVNKQRSEKQRAGDRADQWFSRFIRLEHSHKGSNGELFCFCYTCNAVKHIKDIDSGHYLNRENMQTRHNENNARPQCTLCNKYKSGRHTQFEQLLISDIGQDNVDRLKAMAKIKIPVSAIQLREVAMYYREKVKKLQLKHNVKYW